VIRRVDRRGATVAAGVVLLAPLLLVAGPAAARRASRVSQLRLEEK